MRRNFWILTIGQTLNMLGTNFGQMAQAVLVYNLTGSKLAMGTILLLSMGPQTLLRLFGSPLVDRFNRVRLMATLDIAQTVIFAMPPLLAALGLLQIWHLYIFAVAAGLAGALYAPAYFALVPSIVDAKDLERANSISQTLINSAAMLGPVLAGLLIAAFGPVPALAIDAFSYGISATAMLLMPAALGRIAPKPAGAKEAPYLARLAEGVRFYRSMPILVLVLAGAAFMNFSMSAGNAMLVPYVREHLGLGVSAVGPIDAALAGGMVLGGVIMGWLGSRVKRRSLSMMGPLLGSGLAMVLMAFLGHGQLIPAIVAWGAVGMGIGMYNPQSAATYQRLVPDELRGRVMAVRLTVAWGAMPLGASLGSFVADVAGLPTMLVAFGLVTVLLAGSVMLRNALAQLDAPRAASPAVKVDTAA